MTTPIDLDPNCLTCKDSEGRDLFGFVVDDSGTHWVWAYDKEDAVRVVAEVMCGSVEAYEADIGPMSDAAVLPLTLYAAEKARFMDEGGEMSMLAHFAREQKRGLMATTEV